MFNDYVNEKIEEKIDYDLYLLNEFLKAYFIFLINYIGETEIRHKLIKLAKDYYEYSYKEYKLLNLIKKTYDKDLEEEITLILEQLEVLFTNNYHKIESILNGYYDSCFYHDINMAKFSNLKFNIDYLNTSQKILTIKENKFNKK